MVYSPPDWTIYNVLLKQCHLMTLKWVDQRAVCTSSTSILLLVTAYCKLDPVCGDGGGMLGTAFVTCLEFCFYLFEHDGYSRIIELHSWSMSIDWIEVMVHWRSIRWCDMLGRYHESRRPAVTPATVWACVSLLETVLFFCFVLFRVCFLFMYSRH